MEIVGEFENLEEIAGLTIYNGQRPKWRVVVGRDGIDRIEPYYRKDQLWYAVYQNGSIFFRVDSRGVAGVTYKARL